MCKDSKEIETKKKIQHGWIAFTFILFHFTLIVISILSDDQTVNPVSRFSKEYVNPFFYQKWSMFAPCPLLENRFEFKLYFENDSTDWIDPSINTLEKHSKYRASYHGNIAVGEYNLLFWVKMDLDQLNIPANQPLDISHFPDFKKTRARFLLKNYLKGYSHSQFNEKLVRADVNIRYYNVKYDSTTNYFINNFR